MGSALPIAIGAGQSSIRASNRKTRAVETTSFLDGRGECYGRKRLGGGAGVGKGMFHDGAGGPWGMEREIIGL